MNEILDLRRQVLVGHLTQDRMKDVKRHITARLDWGNEWVPASAGMASGGETCRCEPLRGSISTRHQMGLVRTAPEGAEDRIL